MKVITDNCHRHNIINKHSNNLELAKISGTTQRDKILKEEL